MTTDCCMGDLSCMERAPCRRTLLSWRVRQRAKRALCCSSSEISRRGPCCWPGLPNCTFDTAQIRLLCNHMRPDQHAAMYSMIRAIAV
jgi:hypothetical protein